MSLVNGIFVTPGEATKSGSAKKRSVTKCVGKSR